MAPILLIISVGMFSYMLFRSEYYLLPNLLRIVNIQLNKYFTAFMGNIKYRKPALNAMMEHLSYNDDQPVILNQYRCF